MDDARQALQLHRCRFVDYASSPITALAVPPPPPPPPTPHSSNRRKSANALNGASSRRAVLVLGRANGNVEVWRWAGTDSSTFLEKNRTNQGWVVHQTLYAPRPSKVDSLILVWRDPFSPANDSSDLSHLRLFSTTGGTLLLEWELTPSRHGAAAASSAGPTLKRSLTSQGGAIWCAAANPLGTLLAISCEDGCVRIVDIADDEFTLKRKLDRVKTRILSVAWGPPRNQARRVVPKPKLKRPPIQDDSESESEESESEEEEDPEDQWTDEWLVTGCSDSSLRKWDVKTGRMLERMSTDRTRSEPTLVWAVGVLSDGTIVSGDSMGLVKFWDPLTYTQLHSFMAHGADVLCLSISGGALPNSLPTVYTSGVDQKVTEFVRIKVSGGPASSSSSGRESYRWIQSCSRRLHSHDVRSLAVWPSASTLPNANFSTTTVTPILISGGLDMSPVFTPCAPTTAPGTTPNQNQNTTTAFPSPFNKSGPAVFQDSHYHRTTFTSTSSPLISVASKGRLMACRGETAVNIWRLSALPPKDDLGGIPPMQLMADAGWKKVLEMELRVTSSLVCLALSQDGRWLAVSDADAVKLFHLTESPEGDIVAKRIKSLPSLLLGADPSSSTNGTVGSWGATALQFTPDSKKLVLALRRSSVVAVISLSGEEEEQLEMIRMFDQHRYLDTRARLRAGDEDSVIPEVSRLSVSPDGQWLASADLHGRVFLFNLDSLQLHSTLPTFPHAPTALAFDSSFSSRFLLLGFPNNSVMIYDVELKSLPDWQKHLGQNVEKAAGSQRDPLLGAQFVPAARSRPAGTGTVEGRMNGHHAMQGVMTRSAFQSVIIWGANWITRFRMYPQTSPLQSNKKSQKRKRDEDDGEGEEQEDDDQQEDQEEESEEEMGADKQQTTPHMPGVSAGKRKRVKRRGAGDRELFIQTSVQYRNVMHVECLNAEEMVVVERPLLDVLSTLPPAYFKAKYGT